MYDILLVLHIIICAAYVAFEMQPITGVFSNVFAVELVKTSVTVS